MELRLQTGSYVKSARKIRFKVLIFNLFYGHIILSHEDKFIGVQWSDRTNTITSLEGKGHRYDPVQ